MLIKFGIKVGIAAGAVYYLKEQGVFKSSDEAHQVYGKINNALEPYVQEVKKQLPVEIPDLPSSNQVSFLTKHYWNQGVTATFEYLSDLPETVCGYVSKGVEQAQKNPEVKKFFESFSSSQQQQQQQQSTVAEKK